MVSNWELSKKTYKLSGIEKIQSNFSFNSNWLLKDCATIKELAWMSLGIEPGALDQFKGASKEFFTDEGWSEFLRLQAEYEQRCRSVYEMMNVGCIGLVPLIIRNDTTVGYPERYIINMCEFYSWALVQKWDKRPFGIAIWKQVIMPEYYHVVFELEKVTLVEAIKLSLGVKKSNPIPKYLNELFISRLNVAKIRLSCNEDELINIRKVGKLAASMSWWLPQNFPISLDYMLEQPSAEENQKNKIIEAEPLLISRDPDGQRKWIEYQVKQMGYELENFCNIPNGIKSKIKAQAGTKGITGSVIDDRWKELRKKHQ